MRERNKNKKSSLTDFIRYSDNKMKSEERNAFERELQKDPFAREASEGFASITPEEALKDISWLQKQLKQRAGRRQRVIFYRIAASVAVLMVVSSLFIILERNRTPKQIASVTDQTIPPGNTEYGPATVQADKREISGPEVRISGEKSDRSVDQQNKPESVKETIPAEKSRNAVPKNADSMTKIEVKQADEYISSDQIAAVTPAMAKGKKASTHRMELKEIEADQDTHAIMMPDPSLYELSEAVVTASGVSRAEESEKKEPGGYIPPQPADGKSNFYNYVSENLHRPDTLSSAQRVVVIVGFLVHTDGTIDSIKIIRSPGKPFSDEAIRLIRSGPAWKPAEENGQLIEDKVRLQIVFK